MTTFYIAFYESCLSICTGGRLRQMISLRGKFILRVYVPGIDVFLQMYRLVRRLKGGGGGRRGEPNFIHRFHIGNNRQRGNERSEPDIDFFSIHNSFPALNKGIVP